MRHNDGPMIRRVTKSLQLLGAECELSVSSAQYWALCIINPLNPRNLSVGELQLFPLSG